MTSYGLRFSARSEIGRVRKNNEDSGFASGDLLVVADGMGGHAAGELASAATIAAIVDAADQSVGAEEVLGHLSDAVITSGEYIADVVAANNELAGMGTTMTALALRGDRVAIAHVGDSRAYLFQNGELQQLTKDHTFVQSLVDANQITQEEAATHPRRNLMMRAIDGIHAVDPDLSIREAHLGDRFLLCSDGLCGVIDAAAIIECLAVEDLTSCVTALVEAALAAGAPDNVTVVVADVVDDDTFREAIVIGAAGESETRERLPGIMFPDDAVIVPSTQAVVEPQPHTWLKTVLITIGVAAASVVGSLWWLSQQWYVGVFEQQGVVAIYQGIPVGSLSRLVDVTQIPVASLPEYERIQVTSTLDAASRLDAQATLARLKTRADACETDPTTLGCPKAAQ